MAIALHLKVKNTIPAKVARRRLTIKETAAIIFDLDGVLLDNSEIYPRACKIALEKTGRSDYGKKILSLTRSIEMQEKDVPNFASTKVDSFTVEYGRIWNELCLSESRAAPGARALLQRLRESGFRLGLVTGRMMPFPKTRSQLERLGLLRYFDVIVPRSKVKEGKPSPAQLLLACSLLRLDPALCISVGDIPLDVRAAKSAGMRSVAIPSRIFPRSKFEKEEPNLILHDIRDLASLLVTSNHHNSLESSSTTFAKI